MEQYIKVIGRGTAGARPDGVRIYIQAETDGVTYECAVKRMNEIAGEIGEAGEMPGALKTLSFDVEMAGPGMYRCSAEFCVELPAKPDLCADGLYCLSCRTYKPAVTVEYYVRNAEKHRKEILEEAVRNAKHQAQLLADAAGKRLGELRWIEQLHQEELSPRAVFEMEMGSPTFESGSLAKELFQKLIPEKIQMTQEVLMCWEMC